MIKPKRIFVIGHMGAGKALFAKALAKKLRWQYIDANPSLERYIVMFCCITFLKNCFYYIKPWSVVVVAKFEGNQSHLFDVFAKQKIELEKIIQSLLNPQINEVLLRIN